MTLKQALTPFFPPPPSSAMTRTLPTQKMVRYLQIPLVFDPPLSWLHHANGCDATCLMTFTSNPPGKSPLLEKERRPSGAESFTMSLAETPGVQRLLPQLTNPHKCQLY